MPRDPPVTLPVLPATPGVPVLTEGAPVEVVGACVVPVCVPVCVPTPVLVAPGCVEVVLAVLLAPVVVPVPVLGVAVPVVWAKPTPAVNANTVIANKIFHIEACSFVRIAAGQRFKRFKARVNSAQNALL